MSDDDSLDSVLFSGDDSPGSGAFDPFLPRYGEAAGQDSGFDGAADDSGEQDGPDGVIRYGRFGSESDPGYEQDYDGPLPGAGGSDNEVSGPEEQRERAAIDAGIGHVRRVADQRSGSSTAGTDGRDSTEGVASSIAAAQQRIRADASAPISDDERRNIAVATQNFTHGSNKPKREYQKRSVTEVPTFQSCDFTATIGGLKTNVAGQWILTLMVPSTDSGGVLHLKDSFGLALNVHVERKRWNDDGDT